jgi:hypothetical protein
MADDGTSGGVPSRGRVRQASHREDEVSALSFLAHRPLPSAGVEPNYDDITPRPPRPPAATSSHQQERHYPDYGRPEVTLNHRWRIRSRAAEEATEAPAKEARQRMRKQRKAEVSEKFINGVGKLKDRLQDPGTPRYLQSLEDYRPKGRMGSSAGRDRTRRGKINRPPAVTW